MGDPNEFFDIGDQDALDLPQLKRTGHVAVKHDKYMIVWGGYRDVGDTSTYYFPTDEIWLYERVTEKWHTVKTGSENNPYGTSGSCGLALDDKLFIFGGYCSSGDDDDDSYTNYSNELYSLDRVQLTWQKYSCEGPRPIPCDKMVGWVHEDNLYYFGGFGLPPKTHWTIPMPQAQCQFCYDVTEDGAVSRRGWNNQLVMFDQKTKKWTWPSFVGPPPIPRAAHAAAKVGDKVYIFGGRNLGVRMNDLHCLNLQTMTWSGRLEVRGNVPDGRSWHSLTAISDTSLVVYGGFSQQKDVFSDCWLLNLEALTWIRVALPFKKPLPRLWHTACIGDPGEVLIFGGCTGNILNPSVPKMKECIITLWFTPMSLFRLSLNTVLQHRDHLENCWSQLPRTLQELLRLKLDGNTCLLFGNG